MIRVVSYCARVRVYSYSGCLICKLSRPADIWILDFDSESLCMGAGSRSQALYHLNHCTMMSIHRWMWTTLVFTY